MQLLGPGPTLGQLLAAACHHDLAVVDCTAVVWCVPLHPDPPGSGLAEVQAGHLSRGRGGGLR